MSRFFIHIMAMVFLIVSTAAQAGVKSHGGSAKAATIEIADTIGDFEKDEITTKESAKSSGDDCPCKKIKMSSFLCGVPLAFIGQTDFGPAPAGREIAFENVDNDAVSAYLKIMKRPPRTIL